ncbi:hypothetical protein D3C87_992890 [compost metagenome]
MEYSNVNLSALGVPIRDQQSPPTIDTFPIRFNQNTEVQWREAVGSISETSPERAWAKAFKNYVELCSKRSLFPFSPHDSQNDRIYGALITARRTVVRWMEKHNLHSQLKTRQTHRLVRMTSTGFLLRCEGTCDYVKEALPITEKLGLRRTSVDYAAIWQRDIAAGLSFFVANKGANMSGRWSYGYEISIDIFPAIPGKPLASSKELEEFILKVLYLPILRAYRPQGMHHRLV